MKHREKHATMITLREEQVTLGVPTSYTNGTEMDRVEEERGGLYNTVCHRIYEGVADGDDDGFDVDDSIENIPDERDVLLIEMSKHVKEWMYQLNYVHEKIDEAKIDLDNGVKWTHRRDCVVGDYSQNKRLP